MKRLSILLLLTLVACSNPQKKLKAEVKALESEIEEGFSKEKADKLIGSYDKYIKEFPKDTLSRLYMAKGAELSILNNDPTAALRYIDLFLATYPDDPKAGLMQFKKGIVFDLLIRDGLRAVAEYDIFLKKYPNDPLRQDAINAILLIQNPETFMATITSEQDSISKADSTKGLQ
jgi:outer membrane protein assembly factor BamD (BamD/ComL family)